MKAVQNHCFYEKNREKIKLQRQMKTCKRSTGKRLSPDVGSVELSDNNSTKDIESFDERRKRFSQRKTALVSEVIELIPEYRNFEIVTIPTDLN